MPTYKTYRSGNNIYSVDLMIAFVNSHGYTHTEMLISELEPQLDKKVWGPLSPRMVYNDPNMKDEWERILVADLNYPIMVAAASGKIIDGYHRLLKAKWLGQPTIMVFLIPPGMMTSCLLTNTGNVGWVQNELQIHEVIEMFK